MAKSSSLLIVLVGAALFCAAAGAGNDTLPPSPPDNATYWTYPHVADKGACNVSYVPQSNLDASNDVVNAIHTANLTGSCVEASDFAACQGDFLLEEGCCSVACAKVLEKVHQNVTCKVAVNKGLCAGGLDYIAKAAPILSKTFYRCTGEVLTCTATNATYPLLKNPDGTCPVAITQDAAVDVPSWFKWLSDNTPGDAPACIPVNKENLKGCAGDIGVSDGCCNIDCAQALNASMSQGCFDKLLSNACLVDPTSPIILKLQRTAYHCTKDYLGYNPIAPKSFCTKYPPPAVASPPFAFTTPSPPNGSTPTNDTGNSAVVSRPASIASLAGVAALVVAVGAMLL